MTRHNTEFGRMTGPMDGASRRACDSFADVLPLFHDHELTLAEAAELEMHLSTCSACQARADAYEGLSSVLKAFDAHESRLPVPHVRIQHEVMARVAEQGAHRRAATRTLRIVRIATAAAVLLSIGLGAVLGAQRATALDAREAAALERGLVDVGAPLTPPAAAALAALPADAVLPALIAPADAAGPMFGARWQVNFPALASAPSYPALREPQREDMERLRKLADLNIRVRQFERQLGGEATVWFGIDGQGMHRVGRDALAYLRSSGTMAQWQHDFERLQRRLITTSSPVHADEVAQERAVDVLTAAGLRLRGNDVMKNMSAVPGFDAVNGLRSGSVNVDQLSRGLATQQGAKSWVAALDPLTLQAEGKLRIAETHGLDRVVVFVDPIQKAVLLPDGQLIVEGSKDRVVAEPVWIPASDVAQRVTVRCRVVQRSVRRKDNDTPRLSPWIAGPTIRSMLRRNASSDEILNAIASQLRMADPVRFAGGTFTSWSLADLPHAMLVRPGRTFAQHIESSRARTEHAFRKAPQTQGFVAESTFGKDAVLFGAEVIRIRGKAGAKLLTRLYQSYVLEALVVNAMARNQSLGSFHRPAPARASYQGLRNDDKGLTQQGLPGGTGRDGTRMLGRAFKVSDEHAVHLKVLQVDGTSALVSVTSEGARELR